MYASQTLQVTFSMMGVTAAIDQLQSECWVNEADFGFPMTLTMGMQHISAIKDARDKNLSDDDLEKLLQKLERKYGYDRLE